MTWARIAVLILLAALANACQAAPVSNVPREQPVSLDVHTMESLQLALSMQMALSPESAPSPQTALSLQNGNDNSGSYQYIETFEVNGLVVHAYAYDDLIGPAGRLQSFWIMYPDRNVAISQGSYDAVTEVAQGMGKIGSRDRIYHVDVYEESEPSTNSNGSTSVIVSHSTLTMTLAPLSYEQVKRIVTDYLRDDGI